MLPVTFWLSMGMDRWIRARLVAVSPYDGRAARLLRREPPTAGVGSNEG